MSMLLPAASANSAPSLTANTSVDPAGPVPDAVAVHTVLDGPNTVGSDIFERTPATMVKSADVTVAASTGSLKLRVNST